MERDRAQLLDRRLEQIREGSMEAIRREVEWLRAHNFPVWVAENGDIIDASKVDASKADVRDED